MDPALSMERAAELLSGRLDDPPSLRLRHFGSYEGFESATQVLISEWLPSSDREPGAFPMMHHFHNDPDQTPVDELATDILLPLKEMRS